MPDDSNLRLRLAVWIVALALILHTRWRRGGAGVGLILAYFLSLWVIHWPGAAIHALPWYWNSKSLVIEAGFEQSTYAILSFAAGSVLVAPLLMRTFSLAGPVLTHGEPDPRMGKTYIALALVCYLLLLPTLGGVPTVGALLSVGWNLIVVGIGLICWQGLPAGKRSSLFLGLLFGLCLPLLTLVSQGFVSYGLAAFLTVFTFVATFYRPRKHLIPFLAIVAILVPSLYVTYMRDRKEIRAVVWGGESLGVRLNRVYESISTLEWFDPTDLGHLQSVDERLNQNYLVGASVRHIEAGAASFAYGETIWQSLIALIPRAIWLEKPVVAGSSDIVSRYTGLFFVRGTSVGVGQVMEFYINFGQIGVITGFMLFGVVIAGIDLVARHCLELGDWRGFTLWYLPGLSLLQSGGSLVEVTSSAGAALVTAFLVSTYLSAQLSIRDLIPVFRGTRTSGVTRRPGQVDEMLGPKSSGHVQP